MSLKAHIYILTLATVIYSPLTVYLFHIFTLQRLYDPIRLESEYLVFLENVTREFSIQQKNVIVQIDEVHVKSDISYKGGKIIAPTLDTEEPLKTVLAIMVSSLHKKWSTIVRLVPLSSTKASNLHLIITSVIDNIEKCGLFVQVLCSDNYPKNVNIFKLFSPDKKLFLLLFLILSTLLEAFSCFLILFTF